MKDTSNAGRVPVKLLHTHKSEIRGIDDVRWKASFDRKQAVAA